MLDGEKFVIEGKLFGKVQEASKGLQFLLNSYNTMNINNKLTLQSLFRARLMQINDGKIYININSGK